MSDTPTEPETPETPETDWPEPADDPVREPDHPDTTPDGDEDDGGAQAG
jgi:hypothetical protein